MPFRRRFQLLEAHVGQLIGSKGATISAIRSQCSGVSISLAERSSGTSDWRQLIITGDDEYLVGNAIRLIEDRTGPGALKDLNCSRELSPPKLSAPKRHRRSFMRELEIMSVISGELIGRGGEKINKI
eukprot:3976323-Karenia_brevis.AAC.1